MYATALAIDPSRPTDIYIGTDGGGIFKSIDKGTSWSLLRTPVAGEIITTIAIQPSTGFLLAGTNNGISRSVDGGLTWTDPSRLTPFDPNDVLPPSIAAHPSQACVAFVGTISGVFRTSDCGATWRPLAGSPQYADSFAFDPSDSQVLYCAGLFGTYRSLDGGLHWTRHMPFGSYSSHSIVLDPQSPSTLYFADYPNGNSIYKSIDRGATWVKVFQGKSGVGMAGLAVGSNGSLSVLYAATYSGGILRSFDGGKTWDSPNVDLGTVTSFYENGVILMPTAPVVAPSDPLTVYVASYLHGLFKSSDGAESWNLTTNEIANSRVPSIAVDPSSADTVYAAADRAGLFKSVDAGRSWRELPVGADVGEAMRAVIVDPLNRSTAYVGTSEGRVFKTEDAGETWTNASAGIPRKTNVQVTQLVADPAHSGTIFAAMNSGYGNSPNDTLFKTVDGGATWRPSDTGLGLPPSGIDALTINPLSGVLYAIIDIERLSISRDGGLSWSSTRNGLPDDFQNVHITTLSSFAFDPTSSNIAYVSWLHGPPTVWKTIDGGNSWFTFDDHPEYRRPDGLPPGEVRSLAVDPLNPQIIYAASDHDGVFRSTDGAKTWAPFDTGVGSEGQVINCLVVHPGGSDRIYAGTQGGGVLHLPVSGLFPVPSR